MSRYYPKRPIKSFQDLEVYQKALAICVAVVKRTRPQKISRGTRGKAKTLTGNHDSSEVKEIITKLHQTALYLPVLIATAHSVRFSNQEQAIAKLEEAMLNSNLTVVYLEQFRDLGNQKIEREFFEEQIKNLLAVRMKIMRLQRSWKKFFKDKQREEKYEKQK